MSVAGECTGPGDDGVGNCGREVFRDDKCSAHVKQMQRTGKMVPIDSRTPRQRVLDAIEVMNDALKSDEEYPPPPEREYEERCEKAERALFRAIEAFAKRNEDPALLASAQALQKRCAAWRASIEERRRKKLPVGRPARISPARIADLVEEMLKPISKRDAVKRAARRLRVSVPTVWRALTAIKSGTSDSKPTKPPSSGPQSG